MEISREIFYSLDDIRQAALGTQDPNPLHQRGCQNLAGKKIEGSPIVLGFQLATLIDTEIRSLDRSRQLSSDEFNVNYKSSSYDIRYLRPAHSSETMRIRVKTAASGDRDEVAVKERKSDRITISGESGTTALCLRRTSVEQITAQNSFIHSGLISSDYPGTASNISGFYHQSKRILVQSGIRFLKASMGTGLSGDKAVNRGLVECSDETGTLPGRVSIMYPVALSSSVLAKCPVFSDIDLNKTQLVYSRLKLHINNVVSDGIKDGDILDYWVGNTEFPDTLAGRDVNKSDVHVLAYTPYKELVFRGIFTLTLLKGQSTTLARNPCKEKRKRYNSSKNMIANL